MVDTVRTQAYLTGTAFADGQAAGSITPQDMRDLIVSTGTRNFVNVLDFGADPTGTVDSTVAFQSAMSQGCALVPGIIPGTTGQAVYLLNNCVVPSGGQLIGFNPLNYALPADARPLLQATNSSVLRVLNVDSQSAILLQGLYVDLTPTATIHLVDGISAGSYSMTLRDVTVNGARFGLGGTVAGSTATNPSASRIVNIYNCQFFGCVTGIGDLVDGFVYGGACSSCGNGWLTTTGVTGSVTWLGTRFEECGSSEFPKTHGPASGYGVQILSGSNDVSFTGCHFDQNGNAGMFLANGFTNITGCQFRRNGFNPTVNGGTTLIAASAHIQLSAANHIVITGCSTMGNFQATWGTTPVYCPAASINFAGTNTGIIIQGNDLSGCQGSTAGATNLAPISSNTTWKSGTAPSGSAQGASGYVLQNNLGTGTAAQDVDTR